MHHLDGAVDHGFARNVFVDVEDVGCGVVGVDVGGDEVDGDVVGVDVLEEGRDPCGLRGRGASDLETRGDGLEIARGVVIELKVGLLFWIATPEVEVGFVPDFELPGGDFVDAVACDEVGGESLDHGVPEDVVPGRGDVGMAEEGVEEGGIERHLFGHEAELDEGTDVLGEEAVVDFVDVEEVVGGGVVGGLRGEAGVLCLTGRVVEADLVVEDAVEADGLEVGGFLHGVEIGAVVGTESEDGAAGAEGLLPEVGEGRGGGVGINADWLGCLGVERAGEGAGEQQSRDSGKE